MSFFYDPEGKPLDQGAFVSFYNSKYYLDAAPLKDAAGRQIAQTSRWVEEQMDALLKKETLTPRELINILAWKLGKIYHPRSQQERAFCYHKDWKAAASRPEGIMRYGKPFLVSSFAGEIAENLPALREKPLDEALLWLKEKACPGVGTVYILTLWYFISCGEWPIYDRFAKMALDAIRSGAKPGDIVPYKELPSRNEKSFAKVGAALEQFKGEIDGVFGYGTYVRDRDVDRALWVYGHLFRQGKGQ